MTNETGADRHAGRVFSPLPEPALGRAGRVIAAHPVDAAPGRRRGGADEDRGIGRRIRVEEPEGRPGEELAEILPSPGDVATDVVRVVLLECFGAGGSRRED